MRQAWRDGHGGLVLGGALEGPSMAGAGADHCQGHQEAVLRVDWHVRVNT